MESRLPKWPVWRLPEHAWVFLGGINKADGFNLNAVDIALDKPKDESPWAAGYHVELMIGPDVPTKPLATIGTIGPVATGPIVSQLTGPLVNSPSLCDVAHTGGQWH